MSLLSDHIDPAIAHRNEAHHLRDTLHNAVDALSRLAIQGPPEPKSFKISKSGFMDLFKDALESGQLALAIKLAELPEDLDLVEKLRDDVAKAVTPGSDIPLAALISLIEDDLNGPWLWEALILRAIEEKDPTFQGSLDIPIEDLPWESLSRKDCLRFLELAMDAMVHESEGAETAMAMGFDFSALAHAPAWLKYVMPRAYRNITKRWEVLAGLIKRMGSLPGDLKYPLTEAVMGWGFPRKADTKALILLFRSMPWDHILDFDDFSANLEEWAQQAGIDSDELEGDDHDEF